MISPAYLDVVNLIDDGVPPEKVLSFRPSEETQLRMEELLERHRTTGLDAEEAIEMREMLDLEHVMRMAKVKAREKLARE